MKLLNNTLNNILNINKKTFWTLFLYGVISFTVMFILLTCFSLSSASLTEKITKISDSIAIPTDLNSNIDVSGTSLDTYLTLMLINYFVFIILLLYSYAFFENLIWNNIFKKKTTFRNTSKFLGLTLLLFIILGLIDAGIFFLVTLLPETMLNFGIGLFYLTVFFSIYLFFVGYISFGQTQKVFRSIKNSFKIGIGKLKTTWIPLLIIIILTLAVNLVLLLFNALSAALLTVVQAVAYAAFAAWLRIYLANTLKSVKF